MISRLFIKNFVIVRNIELSFSQGLQILTGETGAGKSVIVGAIDLVLGGRLKTDVFFDTDQPVFLEVEFSLDEAKACLISEQFELDKDDVLECLILTREISVSGKSKFFLNGRRTTSSLIRDLRAYLIDFHGQRDQQKLFDNLYQLDIVDSFAGLDKSVSTFSEFYHETEHQISKLKRLKKEEQEKEERIRLYQYQIEEISSLKLKLNEDVELESEISLISHAEDILNLSSTMEQEIYESENSIYDRLNSFISQLQEFQHDNERIKGSLEALTSSVELLDESVNEIREMQHIIDFDPDRLRELEERFDIINRIKTKYNKDIPGILNYIADISKQIDAFDNSSTTISELEDDIAERLERLKKMAIELSLNRRKAAKNLAIDIENNIKNLAIPDARVEFDFICDSDKLESGDFDINSLTQYGVDEVEIMFSANKGKQLQPLKLAASGGELSRFLLTVKKVMSDKLPERTIIFDEIDTGIGGKTATLLGEFIKRISSYHQVLCISHLAQIAIFSDRHFAIEKETKNDVTELIIQQLDSDERRKEIARMMSGSKSDLALKYADEILNKQELAQ